MPCPLGRITRLARFVRSSLSLSARPSRTGL